MYNFDPYNVLLAIATNIPVLLMTAFVLIYVCFSLYCEITEPEAINSLLLVIAANKH